MTRKGIPQQPAIDSRRGNCPACRSPDIRNPNGKQWRCNSCGQFFGTPIVMSTRGAGSGVIAPRTYRQQLAFDRMQNSGADCAGHTKFNPSVEAESVAQKSAERAKSRGAP